MKIIKIENLKALAPHRPPGYVKDVISRGVVTNNLLVIEDDKYQELVQKYRTERSEAKTWKVIRKEKNRPYWSTAAKRIASGAYHLSKAAVGIGLAEKDVIEARREICYSNACKKLVACSDYGGPKGPKCCGRFLEGLKAGSAACGCRIDNATRVAAKRCPVGLW